LLAKCSTHSARNVSNSCNKIAKNWLIKKDYARYNNYCNTLNQHLSDAYKLKYRRILNMSNSSTSSNKVNVPEAREAMDKFKYEVASEIGVPLKQGYNGDLTSAQNGYVGGYMVKKMIEAQEKQMAGK
jgi:hypothetical protein